MYPVMSDIPPDSPHHVSAVPVSTRNRGLLGGLGALLVAARAYGKYALLILVHVPFPLTPGTAPAGVVSPSCLRRTRFPDKPSDFFLPVDNAVGFTQLFVQPCVLTTELLIFFFPRIALGFRSAFLWSQSFADALIPFAPPDIEKRRVQTLPTKQSPNAASCGSRGLGFFEKALLVFHRVGPSLRSRNDFRIRP